MTGGHPIDYEVAVIIVSYNCKDWLSEAINSVKQFMPVSCQIIVVDNASKDGTVEMMGELFREVHFIANQDNKGFSAANNQGFAVSGSKYVLLLNPDAKLVDGSIEHAFRYLAERPDTLIGPKILNPDLSLQDSIYPYPSFTDVLLEAFFLTYFFSPKNEDILRKDNFAMSGACLLIAGRHYRTLQGLDENLFWMDDVDFCFRAKKNGIAIKYLPDWKIVHVVGESGKKNYKVSISNQLISKLKFFRKQGMVMDFILSVVFIELHILLRLILFLPLSPFKRVYSLKFNAYAYSQSLFFKYIFTGKKQTF